MVRKMWERDFTVSKMIKTPESGDAVSKGRRGWELQGEALKLG